MQYYPEGWKIDTPENKAAMATQAALADALREERILEARALICDSSHNLIVDLHGIRGVIPREEGALGIREGTVRDIAVISRVNRAGVLCGDRAHPGRKGESSGPSFPAQGPGKMHGRLSFPPSPRRCNSRPDNPLGALWGLCGHRLRGCVPAAH